MESLLYVGSQVHILRTAITEWDGRVSQGATRSLETKGKELRFMTFTIHLIATLLGFITLLFCAAWHVLPSLRPWRKDAIYNRKKRAPDNPVTTSSHIGCSNNRPTTREVDSVPTKLLLPVGISDPCINIVVIEDLEVL